MTVQLNQTEQISLLYAINPSFLWLLIFFIFLLKPQRNYKKAFIIREGSDYMQIYAIAGLLK